MNIFDLHCDTIMKLYEGQRLFDMENSHINIDKLKKGGSMAQCFAIFVPTHDVAKKLNCKDTPREYFDKAYDAYTREIAANEEFILPAFSAADIEKNYAAGKISAVLTVEDAVTLDGKIENVDEYYSLGVRMVALTWNYENSLGYPQSEKADLHQRGLKPFGIEAVRRMNQLGIAVDVSHLSEGGFWDVFEHSTKPFVASHSCARALASSPRNLNDKQLRAIGQKGGLVGANYYSRFLHDYTGSAKDEFSSVKEVAEHIKYMANKAGIEAVGLGSDYDGIESTLEWGDYSGQQMITRELEKFFTAGEIEKICYANAMRVFTEITGE